MTTISHPIRNADDWGRVVIAGTTLPGVLTEVSIPPRAYEWAITQGYGQTKVTVFRSVGILEELKFRLFLKLSLINADDWTALEAYLKGLISGWPVTYQKKPKALPITHPAAQFLGCKRVHLTKYWAPTPPQGETIPQFYEIAFQEDVPDTRLKTGKAEPAQLNGVPKPKDAQDAILLQALAAFKGTSVAALTVSQPGPTDPPAIATGKATK